MPRSGWAREPWPLSLRVRSLCSATGEAATLRGPRTAKKKKKVTSEQSPENGVGFEEVRMGGQGILGNSPNEQEEECLGDEVEPGVAQTEDGRDAPRKA